MVFTNTWNTSFEASPADTDNASEGALRIRNLINAIRERMEADLYFDEAGTDADHGLHAKVTFRTAISTPTPGTGQTLLYCKDVNSKSELHFIDEDSNEIPLTSAGAIRGGVPVGAIIPYNPGFYTDGANAGFTAVGPGANSVAAVNTFLNATGWYVCNGAALNNVRSAIWNAAGRYLPNLTDDRFLMGDTVAGGLGGVNTNSHTHTIAHSHAVNSHVHGLNSHTHAVTAHVHGMNNHNHTVPAHVHSMNSHAHTLNNHTHTVTSHVHGMNSHTHSQVNHAHSVSDHTHADNFSVDSHTLTALQMPIHSHWEYGAQSGSDVAAQSYAAGGSSVDTIRIDSVSASNGTGALNTGDTGGGLGHNHGLSGAVSSKTGLLTAIDGVTTTGAATGNTAGAGSTAEAVVGNTGTATGDTGSWNGTSGNATGNTTSVGSTAEAAIGNTAGAAGTTDADNTTSSTPSDTENRPVYLSTFYIIRAF